MTHHQSLLFVVPLMALMIVLRLRRNLGRQSVRPTRMQIRIAFLSLALIGIASAPPFNADLAGAVIAGVLVGVAVAFLGLRYTRFEITAAGRFYSPNLYIGLAVSALFIGRIVYRLMVLAPVLQATAHDAPAMRSMMFYGSRTPLTLGLLGLVIGYYIAYYTGVLLRTKRPAAPLANSEAAA